MEDVTMNVNGTPVRLNVDDRTLLCDLLRDTLGLTGTKIGCDSSSCGACVVLLDGRSVKSCAVLARQAQGSVVHTIEGVAEDEDFLELAESLQRHHGLQCGFCTPGMVMSILGLLRSAVPVPSSANIREHLRGNYCRCTGYQGIVDAVESLTVQQKPR